MLATLAPLRHYGLGSNTARLLLQGGRPLARFASNASSSTTAGKAAGDAAATTTNGTVDETDATAHFAFSQTAHPLDKVAVKEHLHLQTPSKKSYLLYQPAYTQDELTRISETHFQATKLEDRLALLMIRGVRRVFDLFTGYNFVNFNETLWLRRMVFLESIAGVPGMVAAMARHLRSLRRLRRDHGWIHTLLGEAENERMHLLTFLSLKQPGMFFRLMVLLSQGVFFPVYFTSYLLFPGSCHRFVGYLEEEAVKTYSHCLADLDAGKLTEWAKTPAPEIAIKYWRLNKNAMMRDVLLVVRADEANHRDVNHTFSSLKADETNPFDH